MRGFLQSRPGRRIALVVMWPYLALLAYHPLSGALAIAATCSLVAGVLALASALPRSTATTVTVEPLPPRLLGVSVTVQEMNIHLPPAGAVADRPVAALPRQRDASHEPPTSPWGTPE